MPLPTALVRALLASLALALSATFAGAADPVATGNVSYKGQLTAPHSFMSGADDGPNVKVYLEDANVTLSAPLFVDRIGPNFGDFNNAGSGSGSIAAGTQVTDYLLHYDFNGTGGNNDAVGTITFSTPILGLMVFDSALNNSDAVLGVAGVTYYTGIDRGLDNNTVNQGHGDDQFSVTNNGLTLNITDWTTTNIIDEVRVIVAVPEPATFIVPLLAAISLGIARQQRNRTSPFHNFPLI
jgi:hypothetical protein